MRNHYLIFCLLFFVHGVFAADEVTVSVMVGDSVTLHTNVSETQGAAKLQWKIKGENKFIAITDRETDETLVPGNEEERFSDRLNVTSKTGFLMITNLTTTDSRVYVLEIKTGRVTKPKIFNVTVHDVVESVSVMKEDTVTLHTGVKVQGEAQILWKFGDQGTIITHLNGPVDGRWTNFNLNNQTGELTIIDIQSDQTGVFKMVINTSSMILHRKFNIIISDEMKTETVKEGEPVTLHTGLTDITGYDLTWKSEDQLMAEIDRKTKRFSVYNSPDGKFKGRLQRNENTGSLTIRDTRTSDSGDYHLKMSSDSHSLQRSINVTVKDPSPSGAASGICGAGVGLVVWALTVFLLQEV